MKVPNTVQDQKVHENAPPAQTGAHPRPHRGRTGRLMRQLGATAAGLCLSAFVHATDYQLGQGLRLGDTGFTLGGYSALTLDKLRGEKTRVALDDLSLFVWWESETRWKVFAELDYENVLAHPSRDREGESRYLALERLYADYAVNDALTLRVGKFLTPIGRWNQIHATPLVWTTSRPLITEKTFPTNVTGLMATGTIAAMGDGIEYAVYGSRGNEIRVNPAIDPFTEVVGARVTVPVTADSRLGVSVARFEQEAHRDESKRLLGLDFMWAREGYEFSAEAVYRRSDEGGTRDEKGAFAQLVVPLTERLAAVGRLEAFHQAGSTDTVRIGVLGLNYHYTPAIVFKGEWVGTQDNRIDAPHGVMTSVSVLF
ncbi:hypothetical protein G3580_00615 [Nitrogeniibacter mangrovi]|uniref:Porin domain-containing protein n=1 Tax=Nitrogeniibacter mangrovi TaxID=2016596 RepID=A0A6C1B1V4_9RHOO|nr:hypothetical protein [Nitrogeniibacter mangrovi]QID16254.1 hypothetical protein G3580_00615 [Nitrogeniibacter mangrovi]